MAWLISYQYRKVHTGIGSGRIGDQHVGETRNGFEVSQHPAPLWLLNKREAYERDLKNKVFREHHDVTIIHSAIEFDDSDRLLYPAGWAHQVETNRPALR